MMCETSAARSLLIGVDGGQTGIRARVLTSDGLLLGEGKAPGFSYCANDSPDVLGAGAAAAISDSRICLEGPATVTLGMSGLPRGKQIDRVVDPVAKLVGDGRILITNDAVTAHAGALGGGAGVVAAIGTGVVVIGAPRDGTLTIVDGWGYLVDDAGSGTWIGREGLRAALRDRDGRVGAPGLRAMMEEDVGDLLEFHRRLYLSDHPARDLAEISPLVLRAARSGDATAKAIVRDAVGQVVLSVCAAAAGFEPSEPVPVVAVGGITGAGEAWTGPFADALESILPRGVIQEPLGTNLDGAITLMTRDIAHYLDHISEYSVEAGRARAIRRSVAER